MTRTLNNINGGMRKFLQNIGGNKSEDALPIHQKGPSGNSLGEGLDRYIIDTIISIEHGTFHGDCPQEPTIEREEENCSFHHIVDQVAEQQTDSAWISFVDILTYKKI
eukprot:11758451-Ditylum_brightwellii.AAC.1